MFSVLPYCRGRESLFGGPAPAQSASQSFWVDAFQCGPLLERPALTESLNQIGVPVRAAIGGLLTLGNPLAVFPSSLSARIRIIFEVKQTLKMVAFLCL